MKKLITGALLLMALAAVSFSVFAIVNPRAALAQATHVNRLLWNKSQTGWRTPNGAQQFQLTTNGAWEYTGGLVYNYRTVSDANLTVVPTDKLVGITSQSTTRGIYLPDATTLTPGQEFTALDASNDASSHSLIIYPSGSQNINGSNSSVTISTTGAAKTLATDGTQYFAH